MHRREKKSKKNNIAIKAKSGRIDVREIGSNKQMKKQKDAQRREMWRIEDPEIDSKKKEKKTLNQKKSLKRWK